MKIITSSVVACLIFYSCGNNSSERHKSEKLKKLNSNEIINFNKDAENAGTIHINDTIIEPGKHLIKLQKNSPPDAITKADWDKKIIKTATLTVEIKDFKAYHKSLKEKIRLYGGYTAQEDQIQDDFKIENRIVIKVPVDQFENNIFSITENTENLLEKKINAQDVSAEYVDTRSRIEAKRQVRQRYSELLKQAKNMEEVLQVQSVINEIQEEIESASGRMEYLGHSSVFSTINLCFYQVLKPQATNVESPAYGTKIVKAFKTGWRWVADLFVGLITVWPLFMFGIILLFLLKKFKRIKPVQVTKSA